MHDEAVRLAAARHQFDFWLGNWDCTWEGGHGRNAVTAELDGMVIVERFDGRPGTPLRGISVSVYDEAAEAWRQTWVDSAGSYLDFIGGFADGVMELRRRPVESGAAVEQRMRFTEIAADGLVWLWERRPAGGEWETLWRIDYRRR
jgi:Protein of unknown function (DUF1579)